MSKEIKGFISLKFGKNYGNIIKIENEGDFEQWKNEIIKDMKKIRKDIELNEEAITEIKKEMKNKKKPEEIEGWDRILERRMNRKVMLEERIKEIKLMQVYERRIEGDEYIEELCNLIEGLKEM